MTRIYFSGGEAKPLTDALLAGGVRHIAYSFLALQRQTREFAIGGLREAHPGVAWRLDPGAATYLRQAQRGQALPAETYLRQYGQYVRALGAYHDAVLEPDIDAPGGIPLEQVDAWREELLEEDLGVPIVPVWNPTRGELVWEAYCADSRYSVLAVARTEDLWAGQLQTLVRAAQKAGKKVHAMGTTRLSLDPSELVFDSVSSSAWAGGQKYGRVYLFLENTFRVLKPDPPLFPGREGKKEPPPSRRAPLLRDTHRYQRYFSAIGCDGPAILAGNPSEIRRANIFAWRALSNRLVEMRRRCP